VRPFRAKNKDVHAQQQTKELIAPNTEEDKEKVRVSQGACLLPGIDKRRLGRQEEIVVKLSFTGAFDDSPSKR